VIDRHGDAFVVMAAPTAAFRRSPDGGRTGPCFVTEAALERPHAA